MSFLLAMMKQMLMRLAVLVPRTLAIRCWPSRWSSKFGRGRCAICNPRTRCCITMMPLEALLKDPFGVHFKGAIQVESNIVLEDGISHD